MYARFVAILCTVFVVGVTALGCQNRPGVSQPSEDERMAEKDMSTEEPRLQQEVASAPTLQEAKDSEIGEQPPTQEPVPDAVRESNSLAVEEEPLTDGTAPLNIYCTEKYMNKDESKRWRRCYLEDEERDKIRPILAKALDVTTEEISLSSDGYALGPWLSSFYLLGSYYVGELPADKTTSMFVIDANSRTMLSPSKESVADIFRNLKVFSDKPKPFPARAFALLLSWGMPDRDMWLDDFKRYRHRRGICIELMLETRPPQWELERYAIRKETQAFLITKDYDIEELPRCR